MAFVAPPPLRNDRLVNYPSSLYGNLNEGAAIIINTERLHSKVGSASLEHIWVFSTSY